MIAWRRRALTGDGRERARSRKREDR
jgi:hypothetical protein